MTIQVTTFPDGILLNTLQASALAPTFCMHVNQATPHKYNWIPSTVNDPHPKGEPVSGFTNFPWQVGLLN
jgi:hypothetical protein